MRRRSRGRKAIALLLLLANTACYSYVPADFETVPVGEGVRVYLSREGVNRLRELGGEELPGASSDQPVVQGTLVRRTATDFSLRIPVATRQVGMLQSELGQQVTLPTEAAVQVQLRKLSHVKTGLALAGSTAVIAGVIVTIITGGRAPNDTPDPGPIDDIRLPWALPVP